MKKRKNSNVRIVSPPPKRTGNQTLANEEEITSNDEITPGKKDETTAIDEATTGIIGHQFKMFKRLILDPTSNTQIWTSCGKNDEGAEMETAIERYMRTGHFLKPISAEYHMYLWRNRLNIKYCPVFWLLTWISISGIKCGPIWCRTDPSSKEILLCVNEADFKLANGQMCKVYLDANNNNVGFSYELLSATFKRIFKLAGYSTLSLYVFRKTGAKWAARCGAQSWEIKNTGRWCRTSRHFDKYIEQGVIEKTMKTQNGHVDPIRNVWVYRPTSLHETINPELV